MGPKEVDPRGSGCLASRAILGSPAWGGRSDVDPASQSKKLKGPLLSQGTMTRLPAPLLTSTPEGQPHPVPPRLSHKSLLVGSQALSLYTYARVRWLEGSSPQVTWKQGVAGEAMNPGGGWHCRETACCWNPGACLHPEFSLVASCSTEAYQKFRWLRWKIYQSEQALRNIMSFSSDASGKEPTWQYRRHKRCKFNPWIGTIPWGRAWQPTPVFLLGESPWIQ